MYKMSPEATAGFEVDAYLQQRQENDSFVMVEIGHGANPVAHKQPFDFVDDRAYIGIEAWLRYPEDKFKQQEVYTERDGKNIFFINQDSGGTVKRPFEEESSYSYYEGDYDAMTVLPEGAADEVFAGNVFCDPLIAFNQDRAASLLGEMARLAGNAGSIVLREVITPEYSKDVQKKKFLAELGLQIATRVSKRDKETWAKLEDIYRADIGIHPRVGSYYLFLSKA